MTGATYPIPNSALDDRLAIVGTSGSGKTYGAGTAVERVLHGGGRVIIVDPLGVWYGLRSMPDGKTPSAFSVVIFGGAHGDLALNEHAGAIIGETAATMAESCIIDLSGLGTKSAERRFMLAFLEALYRKASGNPVHLVFDEADLWAPQKALEPQLQAKMEQIVRRGRVKGFIPWLITQRPAVLSKDVLSQADGIVAFKLTGEHDRNAVGGWIEGQADKATGKGMLASLARMHKGEAVVWLPGRDVLAHAGFPPKVTFDSSRTPKRGEVLAKAQLQPLNLASLRERLASVEAETKENDPKALKAEIARLKSESQKHSVADLHIMDHAVQRGYQDGYRVGWQHGHSRGWNGAMTAVSKSLDEIAYPNPESVLVTPPAAKPVPAATPEPAVPRQVASTVSPSARAILDAIHKSYPVAMSFDAAARRAGISKRSSAYRNYRKEVDGCGEVTRDGDRYRSLEDFGNGTPMQPGASVAQWVARLPPSYGKMLQAIADGCSDRQSIAEAAGVSLTSSGLGAGLRELVDFELVTVESGRYSLAEGL